MAIRWFKMFSNQTNISTNSEVLELLRYCTKYRRMRGNTYHKGIKRETDLFELNSWILLNNATYGLLKQNR